jgi:CelD/BcsL family acetyltransferase involved in cellulose biosynthesis
MNHTVSRNNQIEFSIFNSFDDANLLQEEWDDFIEKNGYEVFLTFEWCRVWWKYYGPKRQLKIFIFRHCDRIVGIVPLFWERLWVGPVSARVVKMVGTDYMPITVSFPIFKELLGDVLGLLKAQIDREWQWDILYIGALAGSYDCFDILFEKVNEKYGKDYSYYNKTSGVQIYFPVRESWDDQVSSLDRKQRTNARRAFREIEKRNVSVTSNVASDKDSEQVFEDFVKEHQGSWQKKNMPGHFGDWPYAHEFHREVSKLLQKHDRLRILQILYDDECVDYEYLYKIDDRYCWFLNARSDAAYEAGLDFKWIAFRAKIELAISEGVKIIDGMRGVYDYKMHMGGEALPIKNLYIIPKKFLSFFRARLFQVMAWALDIIYFKIWCVRVGPKLGWKRGFLWKSWIKTHVLYPW